MNPTTPPATRATARKPAGAALEAAAGGTAASALAERVREAIPGYGFSSGGNRFRLGAGIGVAVCDTEEPPESVMSRADTARHRAKKDGGNRVHTTDTVDEEMAQHQFQLRGVAGLQRAMEEDRMVLCWRRWWTVRRPSLHPTVTRPGRDSAVSCRDRRGLVRRR